MVTADEFGRSLRGAADILTRRPQGLAAFEMSEAGFRRSFQAIGLTLPAYIVSLAVERRALGLADAPVLSDVPLDLLVGAGHLAGFLALPLAMIVVLRGTPFAARYMPFVIVTNWVAVFGSLVLAGPSILLLLGIHGPELAGLVTLALAVLVLEAHWFAAKATLGISGWQAAGVTLLGLLLVLATNGLTDMLACQLG